MWGLLWKDIANQWAQELQEELNWQWAPSAAAKDEPDDAELPGQWLSTLEEPRRDLSPFYSVIDEQGAGTWLKKEQTQVCDSMLVGADNSHIARR